MLKLKRRLVCSFCRKPAAAVAQLIDGPGVHICDACVDLCNRVLAGKPTPGVGGWGAPGDGAQLASLGYSQAAADAARDVLQRQVDILRRRDISWAAIGAALDI